MASRLREVCRGTLSVRGSLSLRRDMGKCSPEGQSTVRWMEIQHHGYVYPLPRLGVSAFMRVRLWGSKIQIKLISPRGARLDYIYKSL